MNKLLTRAVLLLFLLAMGEMGVWAQTATDNTDNIIFDNNSKSWSNLPTFGSSSGKDVTYVFPASNNIEYSFAVTSVKNSNGNLHLIKNVGCIVSPKFGLLTGYTVTVKYYTKSAFTLTDGINTVNGSGSKDDLEISLEVNGDRSFTIKAGKDNYLLIYSITITPHSTVERVTTNHGFVTYTTIHPIDWAKTRQANATTKDGKTTYGVRAFKVTEFDKSSVVMTEFGVPSGEGEQTTRAETPIVLYGSGNVAELSIAAEGNEAKGNLLHPSINGEVKADKDHTIYVLQYVRSGQSGDQSRYYGWHPLREGRTVGTPRTDDTQPVSRKAYLDSRDESPQVSTSSSSAAKGVFVSFDDVVTGINAVSMGDNSVTGRQPSVFYNLQGQPIANPTRGFYILNGRKIIIK